MRFLIGSYATVTTITPSCNHMSASSSCVCTCPDIMIYVGRLVQTWMRDVYDLERVPDFAASTSANFAQWSDEYE